MQIGQDEIHVELPRTMLGGLKEGPVEDLLRRIARDYAKLELENQRLWKTVEQLEAAAPPADRDASSSGVESGPLHLAETTPSLHEAPPSEAGGPIGPGAGDGTFGPASTPVQPGPDPGAGTGPWTEAGPRAETGPWSDTGRWGGTVPAEDTASASAVPYGAPTAGPTAPPEASGPPTGEPAGRAFWFSEPPVVDPSGAPAEEPKAAASFGPSRLDARAHPDELAAAVLSVAHRAAREMRESAREECELMIRKARSHARKVERELERSRLSTTAEIEELHALKREMREHMRSSLQALLRTFVLERSGELPALDWSDGAGFASELGETVPPAKKPKKSS